MAVLMTAHLPGATKEMVDGMRPLREPIRNAKGFILHANSPAPGGWRMIEVWETQADFEAWFEAHVKPLFPADGPIMPSITIDQLNDVMTALGTGC